MAASRGSGQRNWTGAARPMASNNPPQTSISWGAQADQHGSGADQGSADADQMSGAPDHRLSILGQIASEEVTSTDENETPEAPSGKPTTSATEGLGMSGQQQDQPHERSVRDRLEEWRAAERDAEAKDPDSASRKMAHNRVNVARDAFHDAEDREHHHHGDDRPRQGQGSTSGPTGAGRRP